MLRGIDVSEYQGVVDWQSVRRSGCTFAFAKASQGTYEEDATFTRNWQRMEWRGLVRGAYHYFDARYGGREQADYMHRYVRRVGGFRHGDMIALDLEETFGEPVSTVIAEAEAFVERCWNQIEKTVVVYTGPWFWDGILGNPESSVLRSCPLWLAEWGTNGPTTSLGWTVTSFWQYSGGARQSGVSGLCDLDGFMGTLEQLHKVAGR